jgi:hypothetical protein
MLLFRREEGFTLAQSCTLRQVADRRIANSGSEVVLRSEDVKVFKETLFRDIYRQEKRANQYPLLSYFTCDPEGLLLQEGNLVPDFERALVKFL